MSKILFLAKYPIDDQYTLVPKLNGQMQALKNLGHDVYYISFDRDNVYLNWDNKKEVIIKTNFGRSKFYYHLFSFYDIYKAAEKAVKSCNFDIVYFRYSPLNYRGNKLLRSINKTSLLVVEIPTFPPECEKQKSIMRRIYMQWSYFWWKESAKYVNLFTIIGSQANSYLKRPALNIDNGILVDDIPLRRAEPAKDGKIHLLALASMSNWQGYDRVIKGLAEWDSSKASEYIIDMVGVDGDGSLGVWKNLADQLGLKNQIVFHGPLYGEMLTRVFQIADLGLCSFGMYRKKMNSGSILKLREYMARGLPFIYAHDDPGVKEDMPWCIKVSNDDKPIDMKKVDAFLNYLRGLPDYSQEMRNYAIENMSWESQFKNVFQKLKDITGRDF